MSIDCVVVRRPDHTYKSFARCVADEFVAGVLLVTSIDTEEIVEAFGPGLWAEATVYDRQGYPAYHIARERTP